MGQCEEHLDYCWHRKVILGHVQILYTCMMIVLLCTAGLIIDAFGELRDQQEQVKEDMEVQSCSVFIFFTHLSCHIDHCFFVQTKCFICGIGSDYFDTTPHGFETHTFDEHNLANYMWVPLFCLTLYTVRSIYTWTLTKVFFFYLFPKTYLSYSMGVGIMCRLSAFTWEYQHLNWVKGLGVSSV